MFTVKAHLDYLKRFDGVTRFAGPFLTDDGKRELGSFRILDLADRAAAEEHVANEPFIIEGIQERPSDSALARRSALLLARLSAKRGKPPVLCPCLG